MINGSRKSAYVHKVVISLKYVWIKMFLLI